MSVSRLVAIFGPVGDERVDAQLAALARETEIARRLDVGYLEVRAMPQADEFREIAGLAADDFAVVLVEEGAELTRWTETVEPARIWASLDPAQAS